MDSVETSTVVLRTIASKRPLVIAHRGFSGRAPENTVPSFELALAVGADLVELDARLTRDEKLIVIHDHELDRTTDAKRKWRRRHNRIDARSFSEIKELDAGAWFSRKFTGTQIPLLTEALALIRKASIPLIEQKAGSVLVYLDFLRQHNLVNEVIVQSFDWDFLATLNRLEPALTLGALGPAHLLVGGRKPLGISRKLNAAWLKQLAKTGARIAVWNRQVSKGGVRLAHERGLKVWVYTINEPRLAGRLLDIGVDGLITNEPIRIRTVVQKVFPPTEVLEHPSSAA
ncbi:MAG TPA: glycerophosphodiester phosphodiesterase family protein [Candidatus Limnocylindrales bacterium]|nr:glycerophosphodiester phosphodiesterase family protein [Candidatus Limnocylindrales bacterium]